MVTCRCHHAASLHRHIRDGGCAGIKSSPYLGPKMMSLYRCGCTRNPAAADVELDDPSEEVIARGEARDAQERREENNP